MFSVIYIIEQCSIEDGPWTSSKKYMDFGQIIKGIGNTFVKMQSILGI